MKRQKKTQFIKIQFQKENLKLLLKNFKKDAWKMKYEGRNPLWWIVHFNGHYFEVEQSFYLNRNYYKIIKKDEIISKLKSVKKKIKSTSFFIPVNEAKHYCVFVDKKEIQKAHQKVLKEKQSKMLFIL